MKRGKFTQRLDAPRPEVLSASYKKHYGDEYEQPMSIYEKAFIAGMVGIVVFIVMISFKFLVE